LKLNNTPSLSNYKIIYTQNMVVLKNKTHYKLLDVFITLFSNIPLINTINLSLNMKVTMNAFIYKVII